MDIHGHRCCYVCPIRRIAITSNPLPVGTFPLDVQLAGNLFTHHADLSSAMNENGMFVPMYLSVNGWRGRGVPEFGVSGVIIYTREGKNMTNSDILSCGQGPGSDLLLFGN